MTAKFDNSKIKTDKLDENEMKYLTFFKEIQNNKETSNHEKRIYFYFDHTPEKITDLGPELKVAFKNQKSYNLRNIICSLGRVPSEDQKENADYLVGWASGKGGNLLILDGSVSGVYQKFKEDYDSNKFHQTEENDAALKWQFKSLVNNNEFFNILEYIKAGNNISTLDQFALARNSNREGSTESDVKEPKFDLNELNIKADPNKLIIFDGTETYEITPDENSDMLSQIKALSESNENLKKIVPEHECDGKGTCGTCFYRIIDREDDQEEEITLTKNERDLLRINGVKKGVLCCQHKGKVFKNRVLYHDLKRNTMI